MPDLLAAPPLVQPAHLWLPEWDFTDGDVVADWSEQALGVTPDGEQRLVLDAMYAGRRGEPGPACFETATVAPRQNLKTAVHEVAALADLFLFGDELNVWTAHLFPTARKSFEHMVALIEAQDDLRRRCHKPRTANGQESIQLLSGEKLEFHARSKGGGRGFAGVGKVTLDEALFLASAELGALMPTMATNPFAQVRYASSAGLEASLALYAVRTRGRRGGDPSLAYVEWCAPSVDCADPDCSHTPGLAEGCALDREDLLAQANPALGRRITLETLQRFRRAMPPEEFAREFLGWWDEPAELVELFGEGAWEACRVDPGKSGILGTPTFAIATSIDQAWACIASAGPSTIEGRLHVEPIQHGRRPGWVVDRAVELRDAHGGRFVVDGKGPARFLIADLEEAGLDVVVASTDDLCDACAGTMQAVKDGRLVHMGYPELDTAVAGAQKRDVGDRYAWGRKTVIDISPLEAVTLAAWGSGANVPADPQIHDWPDEAEMTAWEADE